MRGNFISMASCAYMDGFIYIVYIYVKVLRRLPDAHFLGEIGDFVYAGRSLWDSGCFLDEESEFKDQVRKDLRPRREWIWSQGEINFENKATTYLRTG